MLKLTSKPLIIAARWNYRVDESITVELPSGETITHNTDIFSFPDSTLSDTNVRIPTEFPFDFTGGYVGYLGYELMAISEHVEGRSSQLPDAQRLFSDRFFAIDHLESMLYLVALHDSDPSGARNWIESNRRSTKVCAVNALPCESCDLPAQCSRKVSVARQEPLPGKHCTV